MHLTGQNDWPSKILSGQIKWWYWLDIVRWPTDILTLKIEGKADRTARFTNLFAQYFD